MDGARGRCPYCGAVLGDEDLRAVAAAFVRGLDQDLRDFLSPGVFLVGALTILLVTVLVVWLVSRGWSVWAGLGVGAPLLFIGFGAAGVLLDRSEARFFRRKVRPRIETFQRDVGIDTREFVRLASEILGERKDGLAPHLDSLFED